MSFAAVPPSIDSLKVYDDDGDQIHDDDIAEGDEFELKFTVVANGTDSPEVDFVEIEDQSNFQVVGGSLVKTTEDVEYDLKFVGSSNVLPVKIGITDGPEGSREEARCRAS